MGINKTNRPSFGHLGITGYYTTFWVSGEWGFRQSSKVLRCPEVAPLHDFVKRRLVLRTRPFAIGFADSPIHAPAAVASTVFAE
jgi:hypothetical protein